MTQNIPQKTKLIMVILALFMPAFLVLPLVIWGGDTTPPAINKDLQAARLAPVGVLTVGKPAGDTAVAAADTAPADSAAAPADNAAAPTPADSAPAVAAAPAFDAAGTYKASCAACHDNLPNAPKPSDTAGWQARLDKAGSLDALVKSGIQGTAGGMPPKGGSALDDAQFHDMVVYMLDQAKVAH